MNVWHKQVCIMGILNVTPDSFSDGGAYPSTHDALARARAMLDEGAAIIDVGGESTRPGAARINAAEQKNRILDVIEQIAATGALISVDTTLADVARAALDAGAGMINDVSAGRENADMFALAAERGVPICLMHMQGTPGTMQDDPQYTDVVAEVGTFLTERAQAAEAAGVAAGNIVLDPGIGFGKTTEHNLALIANLNRLTDLGYPLLLGTSRKRFMGGLTGGTEALMRVPATVATTAWGRRAGVQIFRVHDVWQNRQALDLTEAVLAAESTQ